MLLLIKRRPPLFIRFVENKYRHKRVIDYNFFVSLYLLSQPPFLTRHVPVSLGYPGGVRLRTDQGIWMVSLECQHDQPANSALPYCRYGVGSCLAGSENCFQQSEGWGGHVGGGLHPHCISL